MLSRCTVSQQQLSFLCFIHRRIGAQSTLGGTQFLPEKYVLKVSKMPEFYIIIARKIFSRILGGGGTCPPTPVSYAYGFIVYSLSIFSL